MCAVSFTLKQGVATCDLLQRTHNLLPTINKAYAILVLIQIAAIVGEWICICMHERGSHFPESKEQVITWQQRNTQQQLKRVMWNVINCKANGTNSNLILENLKRLSSIIEIKSNSPHTSLLQLSFGKAKDRNICNRSGSHSFLSPCYPAWGPYTSNPDIPWLNSEVQNCRPCCPHPAPNCTWLSLDYPYNMSTYKALLYYTQL